MFLGGTFLFFSIGPKSVCCQSISSRCTLGYTYELHVRRGEIIGAVKIGRLEQIFVNNVKNVVSFEISKIVMNKLSEYAFSEIIKD